MSYKVEKITKPLVLGEGPHWDERQQALFFVSIHEKTIHKYVPATGEHTKTTLDGRPGFIIPVEGKRDQFVVGVELKFLVIQWDGQEGSPAKVLKELGEVDQHEPTNRLNDGKADPRGRLFAGTMGFEDPPGTFREEKGALFRIDSARGGKIERVIEKVSISNGLAWDLKEKAFYYTDSPEVKIRRYDYDVETGNISAPRFPMSYKVEKITEPLVLGEGPHWDERQQALFFIGIPDKTINKYVPTTRQHTKTTLDSTPSFIIPVEGERDQFVMGLERKFVIMHWDGQEGSPGTVLRELGEVDQHEPTNRINDGKVDPRGRLYAGTMGSIVAPPMVKEEKGSLYRVDPARGCQIDRLDDKINISNGLAWDLKEKAFYYIDSLEIMVRRYDYDVETGNISNPTCAFDLRKNNLGGIPDGCTIDTDGNLWVAIFGDSCVVQADPRTGKLLQKIPIPVKQVTSVTFGGPNFDVLFVTTASMKIDENEAPPGGATFMVTGLGVKGHPNVSFKL